MAGSNPYTMQTTDPSPVLLALVTLIAAASASAQIGKLVLPLATGDDPRSVLAIGNGHVVVSNQKDAWQHFVKVSTPTTPTLSTSFNPPYGYQWFEAEYTPMWGGRIFTAHRFGGLNIIDVSNPLAPGVTGGYAPGAPSVYHFRGLRYVQESFTNGVLYDCQANQGLLAWNITGSGTVANPVWNDFSATGDANGVEVMGSNLYQCGLWQNSPTVRKMLHFDISNLQLPTGPAYSANWFGQTSNSTLLRKSNLPGSKRMISTRWTDGAEVFDFTASTSSPSAYTLVAQTMVPGITVLTWGSYSFPGTPLVMLYGQVWATSNPATKWHFWWFWDVPVTGAPTPNYFVTLPFETHDVTSDASGRIYIVGQNPVTLRGELWIY